ncbi:MAG: URC4/urg3 family protein [Bacteriovoracaceae bacterium]
MELTKEQVDYLLSPKAIRERTKGIYERALNDKTHFQIHEEKLKQVSDFVLETIKENYPDLKIPFHSRWGHFKVGGINRVDNLDQSLEKTDLTPLQKAKAKIDLVVTSVLLDAGAGPDWSYHEESSKKEFNRSEGLGVASFYMFLEGRFSGLETNPLQADMKGLKGLTTQTFKDCFQVKEDNPLVGVEGRVNLINSLGKCIENNKTFFPDGRVGGLLDYLQSNFGNEVEAQDLLKSVLLSLGSIWPGRIQAGDVHLGDVWKHSLLDEKEGFDSLVPFHKLSQWLTYSLVEPIEEAGFKILNPHHLTGLAEYRNGGLLIDKGLISLRDPELLKVSHKPSSEIIIEWRALTITLLDQIADIVRESLGFSAKEFPLAKVLEGGTWWAGRKAAKEKRSDGTPPLKLDSDGTVF